MSNDEKIIDGSRIINSSNRYNAFKKQQKDMDLNQLDYDAFGKALLYCAADYDKHCAWIDFRFTNLAGTYFAPSLTAVEQYDALIELFWLKRKLTIMHNTLTDWLETMDDKSKQLYNFYFVKRKKLLCKDLYGWTYGVHVSRIARSFRHYLKEHAHLFTETLLEIPFVYGAYQQVCETKKHRDKKEHGNDHSTNER